jgi:hypothetical protein
VNNRNADFAGLAEQLLNMRQGVPSRQAATSRPGFDRFHHRFRLVAENPPVKINQQQRGPFAKADFALSSSDQCGFILLG